MRCLFVQVCGARSHIACIALAGFGSYVCFRLVLPPHMLSLLTGPADSSRGALRHPGFGLSASTPELHPHRLPSRLTSRSSRPRVVASATCFALRLHVSAAPPQGGLTPALGGKEHLVVGCSPRQVFGFGRHIFGQFTVTLSLRLLRNARSHVACVTLSGFGSNDRHLFFYRV